MQINHIEQAGTKGAEICHLARYFQLVHCSSLNDTLPFTTGPHLAFSYYQPAPLRVALLLDSCNACPFVCLSLHAELKITRPRGALHPAGRFQFEAEMEEAREGYDPVQQPDPGEDYDDASTLRYVYACTEERRMPVYITTEGVRVLLVLRCHRPGPTE